MAMTVKNNMSATSTLNRLNKNSNATAKAMGRLSSGEKITGAQDDASGYSISERMRVKIRGLSQDKQNLQNGTSLAKVALGGMDEIKDSMDYLRELALGAANDTMTDEDRAISQKVVDQLIENIDDIATETTFNGIPVLMPMKDGHAEYDINADIVFVIDNTGSMGTPIGAVADGISSFAAGLRAFGANVRFGLVSYGDIRETADTAKVRKLMDFTEDEVAFAAAVRSITATGGGDEPESGLDGLMDPEKGAASFRFRPGSAKHAVVVSDATFRDAPYESDARYSIEETIDTMRELGIQVDTIAPTRESKADAYNEWKQIADGTRGQYVGVNFSDTGEDYEGRLQELLKSFKIGDTQDLYIQEGTKANDGIKFSIYDFRPQVLGLRKDDPENPGRWLNMKIIPRHAAVEALDTIDRALDICLGRQTTYGAIINRMDQSFANVVTQEENVTGSESTIRDADMAREMTEYAKHNVLQQSAQSMLAQANQNLSSVLSLLQ